MRGVVGSPQKTVPGNTTQLISVPWGQECHTQTRGGAEQLLNMLFFQYRVAAFLSHRPLKIKLLDQAKDLIESS